jgi:transaldolase
MLKQQFPKIFLDSGDPADTQKALDMLGFLDGQTTNPSLVAKNPEIQQRIADGQKFTENDLLTFYEQVIQDISKLIPNGSVSIEVYADSNSTKEDLLKQAEQMYQWIPNAHIKLPTTKTGLEAGEQFVKDGGRVNMTLVFTQNQALAVHKMAGDCKAGQVFVSPFLGRLDDIGINGMDLIENILDMYQIIDSKVQVLGASTRNLDHILGSIALGVDILTLPLKLINQWIEASSKIEVEQNIEGQKLVQLVLPDDDYEYKAENLSVIAPTEIVTDGTLDDILQNLDITHELTDKGLAKFASDWLGLIK